MGRIRQGSILAAEVSAASVRAVVLERAGAGGRVTLCETHPLPPPSSPEARHTGIASALRDIAQAVDEGPGLTTLREIRVVVSGPALTLRLLRIPPMPAREIPAAVRYRLPEICATPADKLALDMVAYGEGRVPGAGRDSVLIAAMERAELDEIIGAFQSAGLRPTAVIPLGVALLMTDSISMGADDGERSAATAGEKKKEPMRGVLEVGATQSCLVLQRGGRMLLTREIGLGGDHFTQALARELGLGLDEAEKLKRTYGIPGDSDETAPGEDPSLIPSVRNLLRPLAERLVAEVSRSIEFTIQEHGGPGLADLMMTGGGAALRGLDRGLEQGLGATVRAFRLRADQLVFVLGPGPHLEPGTKDDTLVLASQSAACLGAAWEDPPINLMAPGRFSSGGPVGLRAAALVILGSLALGIYGGSLWRADRRLDATLRAQETRIRVLAPRSLSREALSPEILHALAGAIDFEGMFRDLDVLVPPGVLLDSIRLEPPPAASAGVAMGPRVLRVEGVAAGGPEAAERSLARLVADVEQSDAFANVQRVRSDEAGRRGESTLRFAFTCVIEAGALWREGGQPAEEP